MKMEVTLNPDEIKTAIVEYLERRNMQVTNEISFKTHIGYEGYYDEVKAAKFDGATCEVELNSN